MPAPSRDDVFTLLHAMEQRLDRLEQTVNSATDPRGKLTGELMLWPWDTTPLGYLVCDGSGVSADFLDLFNLLVDAGSPHGTDVFGNPKLPDYRGMTLIGAGHGTAVAGLTDHPLNVYFGSEETILTVDQMPSHNHPGSSVDGHPYSGTPGTSSLAGDGAGASYSSGLFIASEGGDQPHTNFQPSVAVNILVKT